MSIFDDLKPMIALLSVPPEEEIKLESDLIGDLGLDSLDLVELVMSSEEFFGVMISDEALEAIVTVQDAVTAVEDELSKQGRAA